MYQSVLFVLIAWIELHLTLGLCEPIVLSGSDDLNNAFELNHRRCAKISHTFLDTVASLRISSNINKYNYKTLNK